MYLFRKLWLIAKLYLHLIYCPRYTVGRLRGRNISTKTKQTCSSKMPGAEESASRPEKTMLKAYALQVFTTNATTTSTSTRISTAFTAAAPAAAAAVAAATWTTSTSTATALTNTWQTWDHRRLRDEGTHSRTNRDQRDWDKVTSRKKCSGTAYPNAPWHSEWPF